MDRGDLYLGVIIAGFCLWAFQGSGEAETAMWGFGIGCAIIGHHLGWREGAKAPKAADQNPADSDKKMNP